MNIFYEFLVVIHVFSAILGIGPGFVLIQVVKTARTLPELKQAYRIKKTMHIFVMIGGTLLIVTGLLMGSLRPALFQMGWYVTSLVLFLVALALVPLVLKPKTQPIRKLLEQAEGEEIPAEYPPLEAELHRYERLENTLIVVIILLMILKPF